MRHISSCYSKLLIFAVQLGACGDGADGDDAVAEEDVGHAEQALAPSEFEWCVFDGQRPVPCSPVQREGSLPADTTSPDPGNDRRDPSSICVANCMKLQVSRRAACLEACP